MIIFNPVRVIKMAKAGDSVISDTPASFLSIIFIL